MEIPVPVNVMFEQLIRQLDWDIKLNGKTGIGNTLLFLEKINPTHLMHDTVFKALEAIPTLAWKFNYMDDRYFKLLHAIAAIVHRAITLQLSVSPLLVTLSAEMWSEENAKNFVMSIAEKNLYEYAPLMVYSPLVKYFTEKCVIHIFRDDFTLLSVVRLLLHNQSTIPLYAQLLETYKDDTEAYKIALLLLREVSGEISQEEMDVSILQIVNEIQQDLCPQEWIRKVTLVTLGLKCTTGVYRAKQAEILVGKIRQNFLYFMEDGARAKLLLEMTSVAIVNTSAWIELVQDLISYTLPLFANFSWDDSTLMLLYLLKMLQKLNLMERYKREFYPYVKRCLKSPVSNANGPQLLGIIATYVKGKFPYGLAKKISEIMEISCAQLQFRVTHDEVTQILDRVPIEDFVQLSKSAFKGAFQNLCSFSSSVIVHEKTKAELCDVNFLRNLLNLSVEPEFDCNIRVFAHNHGIHKEVICTSITNLNVFTPLQLARLHEELGESLKRKCQEKKSLETLFKGLLQVKKQAELPPDISLDLELCKLLVLCKKMDSNRDLQKKIAGVFATELVKSPSPQNLSIVAIFLTTVENDSLTKLWMENIKIDGTLAECSIICRLASLLFSEIENFEIIYKDCLELLGFGVYELGILEVCSLNLDCLK